MTTSPPEHHREATSVLTPTSKLPQMRAKNREMTTFAKSCNDHDMQQPRIDKSETEQSLRVAMPLRILVVTKIVFDIVFEIVRAAKPAEVCLWNFWWHLIWNLIWNLKFLMGKIWWNLGGGLFYLPGKHDKIRGEFRGKFRRKFRKLRFKFRDFFRKLRSAEARC